MEKYAEVSDLKGKILTEIKNESDELRFICQDGSEYLMYHSQSCCEDVFIDDIEGDLKDLIGSPLLQAEETSNEEFEKEYAESIEGKQQDSYTWTFYKFATIKSYVTIKWLGESNGYYSESVDFIKTK